MCCFTHQMPVSETGGEEAGDERFRCVCPSRIDGDLDGRCIRRMTQEDLLCDICSGRAPKPGPSSSLVPLAEAIEAYRNMFRSPGYITWPGES